MIPRFLMCVAGMGDPAEGDSTQWAEALLGQTSVLEGGSRYIDMPSGDRVTLLEVNYEDLNELSRSKYEELNSLMGDVNLVGASLQEYAGDVAANVLFREPLRAAVVRFRRMYTEAFERIPEEVDPRSARMMILCHSLGTLITYEGLHAVAESRTLSQLGATVAMCAPMLAPICAVQGRLGIPSTLTRNRSRRPWLTGVGSRRWSPVRRLETLYDAADPFFLIHDARFYAERGADLVDRDTVFDSGIPRPQAHLITSYLSRQRERIRQCLFA